MFRFGVRNLPNNCRFSRRLEFRISYFHTKTGSTYIWIKMKVDFLPFVEFTFIFFCNSSPHYREREEKVHIPTPTGATLKLFSKSAKDT